MPVLGRGLAVASSWSRTGYGCEWFALTAVACPRTAQVRHSFVKADCSWTRTDRRCGLSADMDHSRTAHDCRLAVLHTLRGCCAFCCVEIARIIRWMLRGLIHDLPTGHQLGCYVDFGGNCSDTSGQSRQPLRGHSPTWRKMFPANCSDIARQLPGKCPDDSSVVARMFRRTLRGMLLGHCATFCLTLM